VKQETDSMFVM